MQFLVRTLALGSALAILAPAVTLSAQSTDPSIGTWTLELGKSKFKPGPAPKSVTVSFASVEAGTKVEATVVAADGASTETRYTAKEDGKDYPVTGSPDYDVVSVKRIDASTREITRKMGGKVVQTARSVFSDDGKVLTVTTKGTNARGEKIENVAVFQKA